MRLFVSLFIALLCAIVVPSVANADSPVYVASKGCPTGSFDFVASLSDDSGGLYLDLYNDTDGRIVLPVRWRSYELCDINFYTANEILDAVEQDIEWQWLLGSGFMGLVIVRRAPSKPRHMAIGFLSYEHDRSACAVELYFDLLEGSRKEYYPGEANDVRDFMNTEHHYAPDIRALMWPKDWPFDESRGSDVVEQAVLDLYFEKLQPTPEWWEEDDDPGGRFIR